MSLETWYSSSQLDITNVIGHKNLLMSLCCSPEKSSKYFTGKNAILQTKNFLFLPVLWLPSKSFSSVVHWNSPLATVSCGAGERVPPAQQSWVPCWRLAPAAQGPPGALSEQDLCFPVGRGTLPLMQADVLGCVDVLACHCQSLCFECFQSISFTFSSLFLLLFCL